VYSIKDASNGLSDRKVMDMVTPTRGRRIHTGMQLLDMRPRPTGFLLKGLIVSKSGSRGFQIQHGC